MTRQEYRDQVRSRLLGGRAMLYYRWFIQTERFPDADPAGEGWHSQIEIHAVNAKRVPLAQRRPPTPPPSEDFSEDEDTGPNGGTMVGPPLVQARRWVPRPRNEF